MRRVRDGDATAEADLVERYSRGLLFLLRRITRDPALAEDLHQEAFVVVLERLRRSELERPERLVGFLRATAVNLYSGHRRKTARRGTDSDPEGLEQAVADDRNSQLGQVLKQERSRAVRRALGELQTDRDRQILYRFYLLEEAKETICTELGLTGRHFNRVLFRARQRFGEILRRGGDLGRGGGALSLWTYV